MSDNVSRRSFLRYPFALGASLGMAGLLQQRARAIDYTKPVPEAKGLTAYFNSSNVLIRNNNMPLTAYRAHDSLKYPYFSPVNGPVTGISLTSESALPYPHHRSLWLGCQPVNGGDYWADNSLNSGQIRADDLSLDDTTVKSVIINNRCTWIRKDAPSPFKDERIFTISVLDEKVWTIDADLKITALEDVSIKKAKHSFFAIRAASDISPPYGGILANSQGGVGAKGTYGKEAEWCGYHGRRAGRPDIVEGIAVMTHPKNPFRPIWFTRDYGHLSPSPFNFQKKPWTIEKGQSIRLRYRVALHAGTPSQAGLDKVYRQWLKETP